MLSYRAVLLFILILCNQYSVKSSVGADFISKAKEEVLNDEVLIYEIRYRNETEKSGFMTRVDQEYLSEYEALDKVKEKFATNFIKVFREDGKSYYYKLDIADYYLVSEGLEGELYYLIHLYEFVLDEIDTGLGHTVTYGWFAVNRRNGEIEERIVY